MDTRTVVDDVTLDHVPLGSLVLRVAWIAIRLILVLYFGQQGALFFYQNF